MPIRPTPLTSVSPPVERERLEATEPRIVITMVHGTFASKAPWIRPNSPFSQLLLATLSPAVIDPFVWSGGNGVRARAKAVDGLRDRIVEVRRKYPRAQHAFVAHSHGGNVVLSALADLHFAKHTLGVATLGTPFLHASLREREPLFGPMDGFVAALFAGIAVFAVGAALGHGRTWWLPGLLAVGGVTLVLLAASYVASLMRRHAERVRDLMPSTRLEPAQLAIVRTSADEAAAALSGARVAGGFASIFWSMATHRLVERLRALLQKMDYFSTREFEASWKKGDGTPRPQKTEGDIAAETVRNSVLSVLPTLVLMMLDDANIVTRSLGAVLAVAYGLPAIVALLISIASIPFGIVFALGLLPCGWTLPFAGPYLDLTAEPAPPGTWSVTQLHGEPGAELSHGRSHDDPEAISFVCRWLSERLVASETSTPASV
jgi:type IV secretory pathway VirB2 component (pilin)